MKTYTCKTCGEAFRFAKKPCFCPLCGGTELKSKVDETAKRLISEINELMPKFNEIGEQYAEIYAELMKRRETLKTYAARGIIEKSEVPKVKLSKLSETFYASRKSRKETR